MAKAILKKTKTPAKKAAGKKAASEIELTADAFVKRVKAMQSDVELKKILRYFKSGEGKYGEGDRFIGVRMGHLFNLAKEFIDMPPKEIERLLESPIHEVRAGAMSIMDKQGRNNKTTDLRRKELFNLYLKRHDCINNWDLVDLGAQYVIGRYLFDKKRTVLYTLAKSKNLWERRTAMLSTAYFIRQGETEDTIKLAEILVKDKEDLIHKVTGWMLRFVGDKDKKQLLAFLDKHAATMPRTMLRAAIEKLDKKQRALYLAKKQS